METCNYSPPPPPDPCWFLSFLFVTSVPPCFLCEVDSLVILAVLELMRYPVHLQGGEFLDTSDFFYLFGLDKRFLLMVLFLVESF